MHVHSRSVTIVETAKGWLNTLTGVTHKTAVLAHNAVMKDAKAINADAVVTEIQWETKTHAGFVLATALSQ